MSTSSPLSPCVSQPGTGILLFILLSLRLANSHWFGVVLSLPGEDALGIWGRVLQNNNTHIPYFLSLTLDFAIQISQIWLLLDTERSKLY